MLHVEGLTAGYGAGAVLNDLSLTVEDGDRVAILGRNGVGKTTLLRALVGEVKAQRGQIRLDGVDVTREPAHRRARRGIAYVPQGRDIFPGLSVLDNLRVAVYGTGAKDVAELVEGVMDEFPVLREKAKLPGAGLSGGQQQILALARALVMRPRLLLLDEPSEGIQPSIVDQIAEHVRRVNEERGITVVIVEQNLEFAGRVAERAVLVDKGQVVRELATDTLLTDRDLQHEYLGV
ncbi:ABC transporter ATP-binding protein [Nocardioides sp. LHG3406-4]|uniref:ABC transporter ATP-binding protein n=1 Tax=Nocardioides sp. LHG3406-4 TaxID=2804575 RepID=UPI003CE747CA